MVNRKDPFANRYSLTVERAFTLIELLVATSILGVIGLTILATFGSGFRVFERVQAFGGAQTEVLLALEGMEKDIKNLFPFSTIDFEGDMQSIAFPAVIETSELIDDEESIISSIGRIFYYIDDAVHIGDVAKGLIRAEQNYSQAIAGIGAHKNQSIFLAPVESIFFEYYYFDEEEKEYEWQESWGSEDEGLLSGIKIEIVYKDGDQDVLAERTVIIPTVQKIFEIEEDQEEEEEGEE